MDGTKKIELEWKQLLTSADKQEEAKSIDKIRETIHEYEASIVLVANLKNGQQTNVSDANYDQSQAVDYDLEVSWENSQFFGKKWKPKDHDSIYRFYLE